MLTEISILDQSGKTVAKFVWDGDLYVGRGRFEQVDASPEQAKAAAGVVEINQYLHGVRFRSAGKRETVAGWFGLEGTVAALRISLPAVGLSVGHFDPTEVIAIESSKHIFDMKTIARLQ